MAGKLTERAALKGGTIEGVTIIGSTTADVTETVARAPSFYRALAVAAGNTYQNTVTIARATVGAKGSATIGRLRIDAPVDTANAIVQKYTGTDGVESKRVSTNESTWGNWRKVFDEVDKPDITTDVTGAGTAAQADTGTEGVGVVPTFDQAGTWQAEQRFHEAGFCHFDLGYSGKDAASPNVTISGGVAALVRARCTLSAESGTADDLDQINYAGASHGQVIYVMAAAGHTITVKHGSPIELGGSDFTLTGNKMLLLLARSTSSWTRPNI